MSKKTCIEFIENEFDFILKDRKEAEKIYEIAKDIAEQFHEDTKDFIEDYLNVFTSAEDAFDWFMEGSPYELLLAEIDNARILISEEDVNKSLYDVIIESYLNDRENYEKINDNLHLTWWL